MNDARKEANDKIRSLRQIIAALEKFQGRGYYIDDEHLDIYREWLAEAIAEREAL